MKFEISISMDPSWLPYNSDGIAMLRDKDVVVDVTARWRFTAGARFDQYGQVDSRTWLELVDYTVDAVFVNDVKTTLTDLHPDIQDAIANSREMFAEVEREGKR